MVELNDFIRTQVTFGQYGNACEVVLAGLRLLVERQIALGRPTVPAAKLAQAR